MKNFLLVIFIISTETQANIFRKCLDAFKADRFTRSISLASWDGVEHKHLVRDLFGGTLTRTIWHGDVEVFRVADLDSADKGTWHHLIYHYAQQVREEFHIINKISKGDRPSKLWVDNYSEYRGHAGYFPTNVHSTSISKHEFTKAIANSMAVFRERYDVAEPIEHDLSLLTVEETLNVLTHHKQKQGRSEIHYTVINYTRPVPTFSNEGLSSEGGLVFFTESEISFAKAYSSSLRESHLLTLRCFHPLGFVFEISFLNGAIARKYLHL